MSQFHRSIIRCPRCLNDIDAVIWDLVDTAADPDLKERLLQKKIQQQVCLNCGNEFILAEPMLYREEQNRLLVMYTPGTGNGSAQAPTSPGSEALAPKRIPLPDPSALPGWHLRQVTDYNSLIETIHVFDHFCDDRLMAVVKVAIRTQGCLDPDPAEIYFLTADDQAMRFMARSADDQWFSIDFPPDIYTNTETIFLDALPPENGWLTIDISYGVDLIRQQTAQLEKSSADGSAK